MTSHFGCWSEGLRRAGLEPGYDRFKWADKRDILDALRRLERELGRQPTSLDVVYPPPDYPNSAVITRRCGSWAAAARELGWKARITQRCSDEQMIVALQIAQCELGANFGVKQYKAISGRRGWPSANAMADRFGSWNAACREAGLAVRPLRRGWSAQQLSVALGQLAEELGRAPTSREWDAAARERGWPQRTTVIQKLGAGTSRWSRVTQAIEPPGVPGGHEPG
ncbi:MAG: hypothetical protein ABSG43_22250 [Solirubrobacteraceae bacterium]